jgi:CelD/BcsL family acetyltransferase involved in cellulose biosynthesis
MIESSIAQISQIESRWRDLCGESGADSPFLTPDWFGCCIAGYGNARKLRIVSIEDSGRLEGIAPLWYSDCRMRGIPLRQLGFIDCPDSPFVDMVVRDERRQDVLDLMLKHIRGKKDWDLLSLERWPSNSPNLLALQEIAKRRGLRCRSLSNSSTPYIETGGEWDAFLKSRSVKFRKTHRNIINRIGKVENIDLQCYRRDDDGSVLKDAEKVTRKGWKHSEGKAFTSREETRRFFAELTRVAANRGWLHLWLLKAGTTPIAMEYDLHHHGVTYALRSDFDEEYKDISPGAYLEYHIVKQHFDNSYREYSTGPGLNGYKLHWTEAVRNNMTMQVFNNTFKGRIAWILETEIVPKLKKLRHKKQMSPIDPGTT